MSKGLDKIKGALPEPIAAPVYVIRRMVGSKPRYWTGFDAKDAWMVESNAAVQFVRSHDAARVLLHLCADLGEVIELSEGP